MATVGIQDFRDLLEPMREQPVQDEESSFHESLQSVSSRVEALYEEVRGQLDSMVVEKPLISWMCITITWKELMMLGGGIITALVAASALFTGLIFIGTANILLFALFGIGWYFLWKQRDSLPLNELEKAFEVLVKGSIENTGCFVDLVLEFLNELKVDGSELKRQFNQIFDSFEKEVGNLSNGVRTLTEERRKIKDVIYRAFEHIERAIDLKFENLERRRELLQETTEKCDQARRRLARTLGRLEAAAHQVETLRSVSDNLHATALRLTQTIEDLGRVEAGIRSSTLTFSQVCDRMRQIRP